MGLGIDISRWQRGLDIASAKNEGVEFGILKAGGADDGMYEDSCFRDHLSNANDAGVNVPATYYYADAYNVDEAREQARHYISIIEDTGIKRAYMDVEADMLNQDSTILTDCIVAFCDVLINAGYTAGIYASRSPLNNVIDDSRLGHLSHWVAAYTSIKPVLYTGFNIDIWQFGGGINLIRDTDIAGHTVDQNYNYIDFEADASDKPEESEDRRDMLRKIVRADYVRELGRDADAEGLENFVSLMENGASEQEVINLMVGSPEWAVKFVGDCYHAFLGRGGSDEEINTWIGDGSTPLCEICDMIYNSEEARAHRGE